MIDFGYNWHIYLTWSTFSRNNPCGSKHGIKIHNHLFSVVHTMSLRWKHITIGLTWALSWHMQQKSFAPPTTQKSFSLAMQTKSSATSPKDDPMQIDETRFKLFMEQKKQRWHTNNICLYCGKLGHVAHECPKKCGPHGRWKHTM